MIFLEMSAHKTAMHQALPLRVKNAIIHERHEIHERIHVVVQSWCITQFVG